MGDPMASDDSIETNHLRLRILKVVVVGGLVLFAGVAGMCSLASMKKPPSEAKIEERGIHVNVIKVAPADVQVSITGYGEVTSLNEVAISPEIPGTIVYVHPKLETGEVISESEVLFKIDDRNYMAAKNEAEGSVNQWQNGILRMKKQFEIDKERLKTIERNRELSEAEFKRIRRLYEKDNIGSQSGVDRAEQAYNAAADQADQMAQAVSLYPLRIKEAENSLASARARYEIARVNYNRCEVRAPFMGRVKHVSLEKGQYVTPGQPVVTLSDDSVLEIQVALDSRDAQKWLRFSSQHEAENIAWFAALEPVTCKIYWTEAHDGSFWKGLLNRVVKFDPQTRTITVAIQIKAKDAWLGNGEPIPLVDGMFCSVIIPGKTMKQVVAVPSQAVSFEGTVYISKENRLKTIPVDITRSDGNTVYIGGGLNSGDLVITTRLVDPMENALLKIEDPLTDGNSSELMKENRGA